MSKAEERRKALREQAREWARKTCEEQGVPVKVTDGSVIARVLTLWGKATPGATVATPG